MHCTTRVSAYARSALLSVQYGRHLECLQSTIVPVCHTIVCISFSRPKFPADLIGTQADIVVVHCICFLHVGTYWAPTSICGQQSTSCVGRYTGKKRLVQKVIETHNRSTIPTNNPQRFRFIYNCVLNESANSFRAQGIVNSQLLYQNTNSQFPIPGCVRWP